MEDTQYARAPVFQLGGQYQECSLAELAWRMGFYKQHVSLSPQFDIFLQATAQDYSKGVYNYGFWTTISKGNFKSMISQESHIRSPIHSLIHNIVTFLINHKKHGNKVTSLNLFYLWSIFALEVFCNVHYFLATYLGQKAVSSKTARPVAGRHFMT